MKNRIVSYQNFKGELIDFTNVSKEYYKLRGKETTSNNSPKVNYIVHRFNNTTYKTTDFENWEKIDNSKIANIPVVNKPLKPKLILFPKAVENSFEFDAQDGTAFTVFTEYGYQVYDGNIANGSLDLSKLSSGLYLVQINNVVIKINKL